MRKKPVRKLLVACITGALFFPYQGFALGLGNIEVSSFLNQDLNADIKLLSAQPEDAQSMIVKLASRKEFTRAGLDRPYSLNKLKFKTVIINNVPHIKVTTQQPVREPYLNFLLEVDWPKGRLLREYTILLDPPTFMSTTSAPVQTATTANNAAFRPAPSSHQSVSPTPVSAGVTPVAGFRPRASQTNATPARQAGQRAAVARQSVQRVQKPGNNYRVQSGDTAWSLAASMRPNRSVSVEQMMMALLRANPDSFNHNNINGLKRGYILRIPDATTIATISPAQAQALVRKQTALWQQYRKAYTAGQPVSVAANPATSPTGNPATGGGIKEPVEEKGARLQIVSAGTGASTNSTKNPSQMNATELRGALAMAREKLETERVKKESLQQEVDQLEHQVSKMKGVLPIENNKLAEAQTLAEKTSSATSPTPNAGSKATGTETEKPTTEQKTAKNTSTPATPTPPLTEKTASAEKTGNGAVATQPTPVQLPVNKAAHQPAGPLSQLLNNPMLLAAASSGLLLLLALIYLVIKRRKESVEETEIPVVAEDETGDLEDIADMVEEDQRENHSEADADEEEGKDPDAESTVIMDAEETVAEDVEEEAEEPRDDVIAEADVYLAYGIYQQAEDLLENAIKKHPERDNYRVKLAETHYTSKNKDAFLDTARQLKQNSGDDTPAWKKVRVMGQDMCADDPLFQGSLVGGLAMDALAPKTPEMDFDLGMETDAEPSSEDDVHLDEPLDLPDMEQEADDDSTPSNDEEMAMDKAEESAAPVADAAMDELEFDLSETAAVAEEKTEDSLLDEEFSLDIAATELDIDEDQGEADTANDTDIVLDLSDDNILDELGAGLPENGIDLESVPDQLSEATDEEVEAEPGKSDVAQDADLDLEEKDNEGKAEIVAASAEDAAATAEIEIDESDVSLQADTLDVEPLPEMQTDTLKEETTTDTDETPSATEESADSVQMVEKDHSEEEEFDLSSLDDVDEISTKLDLARAYLDMGDHEGTKEILDEVLADGNDEQKREASELMGQLDG